MRENQRIDKAGLDPGDTNRRMPTARRLLRLQ
jgi:hypothetical protein